MTDALFLADLESPEVGSTVQVTGDEGRHAALVRRIRKGEVVMVSNGIGTAVRGVVTVADVNGLTLEVSEVLHTPNKPLRFTVVQALAKGDRAEAAVEMLTELGVDEIVPWQAERSIVRWAPDRVERALARWRATAREATKQSRRFRVPRVSPPMTTAELALRLSEPALTLVLHEDAEARLADLERDHVHRRPRGRAFARGTGRVHRGRRGEGAGGGRRTPDVDGGGRRPGAGAGPGRRAWLSRPSASPRGRRCPTGGVAPA